MDQDRCAARLGRKPVQCGDEIASWRKEAGATIQATAIHFGISAATVKRYCATANARRVKMDSVYAEVARIDKRSEAMERWLDVQRAKFLSAIND